MSPPHGHRKNSIIADAANHSSEIHALQLPHQFSRNQRFSQQDIKNLCAALEVPFDPQLIDWRVTNTSNNGKLRGQVIPYADQRAYIDRLNQLFTPAGWTRKYDVHTSANFQRSKDQKIVAKVFVTCELRIRCLGTHSATGEEWADDQNAGTSAEAQAFKRACCCFGLGRYLYYFAGMWVDLDDKKRPKCVPMLPRWATPDGWRAGMRPIRGVAESQPEDGQRREMRSLISQIEALSEPLGKGLYRGLLKTIARVWVPAQVRDLETLKRVLAHMQAAVRGLQRLDMALNHSRPKALSDVLRSMQLRSLDQVNSLEMLKRVVLAVEANAQTGHSLATHNRQ